MGQPVWPEVDIITRELEPGDRFLFCTDGVTRMILDSELGMLVRKFDEPKAALEEIVGLAVRRGGPDNATALLLYYIFEIGFRFWDSSYAAALTMVLLTLLAVAAIVQFAFLERRTHYQ